MKKLICLTCSLVFIFSSCGKEIDPERKIYIDIAKNFAVKRGKSINKIGAFFDTDNQEWNRTLGELKKDSPDFAAQYDYLTAKDIQSVKVFMKKKGTLGGVIWVLIDKKTNEVVGFCGEK